jgi:hypothetical protein
MLITTSGPVTSGAVVVVVEVGVRGRLGGGSVVDVVIVGGGRAVDEVDGGTVVVVVVGCPGSVVVVVVVGRGRGISCAEAPPAWRPPTTTRDAATARTSAGNDVGCDRST